MGGCVIDVYLEAQEEVGKGERQRDSNRDTDTETEMLFEKLIKDNKFSKLMNTHQPTDLRSQINLPNSLKTKLLGKSNC